MIDSARAAAVRRVARLRQKDARSETGLFLSEGPQAAREALRFRPEAIVSLYTTATALERHPELSALAAQAGVVPEPVSERVIAAMSDTVTPQGIVAVCRQFAQSARDVFAASPRLVAVLERVRDPGNAGTILRAADAAGADAVVFSGESVDVFNPKVVRSTTGSLFHVPVVVGARLDDIATLARAAGLRIVAADVNGDDFLAARGSGELARPTAWVFGNEAHGLTAVQRGLLDGSWRLPIFGSAESLNLATAASVCLYESAFAQHAGHAGPAESTVLD